MVPVLAGAVDMAASAGMVGTATAVAVTAAILQLPRSQCIAPLIRLPMQLGLRIWTGVLTTVVATRQLLTPAIAQTPPPDSFASVS